jgi:steroid 5-alpha reductase family enzyme
MVKTILGLVVGLVALTALVYGVQMPDFRADQVELLYKLTGLYVAVASVCFLLGEATKNYSQVDKLWSVIPVAYVWMAADASQFAPRPTLMAVLATLWGARLTFNFARRGGYSWIPWKGDEDYRWALLRANPAFNAPWKWSLFNFFFISFYQQGLILLFTLPIVYGWTADGSALTSMDALLTGAFLVILALEFVADQQQWNYQTEKHRRLAAGEPLGDYYGVGFTHTGLWKWVRHPNYASEQAIWLVFAAFAASATGLWLTPAWLGAALLLVLFNGSANFSEGVTAGKYPAFENYKKKTGKFLPRLRGN